MRCGNDFRHRLDMRGRDAPLLHQIPDFQMIGSREAGHRIQAQVLSPPLDHLVILVFYAAQSRRLLLRQPMPLPQLAESLPEEFRGSKMIGHPCRLGILDLKNTAL